MKYYIIAGEPSGDLHGSNLMKAIQRLDKDAKFSFWGGDHMLSVDDNIVTHIRETSIMGFVEVVKNLPKINSFFKKAKQTILNFKPDVVVFIDYPGFNLRMAKWAKKKGFGTVYYISPQLWAWKKGRVKTIKKYVDEMIVILPFELEFYKNHGIEAHYAGHPLVPVIQSFKKISKRRPEKKILAILPGSRKQEIKKILPELVEAAIYFKNEYQLCIAMAPNIGKSFYANLIETEEDTIRLVDNETYDLLLNANIALVTSGTATLETALFGVPQVVCYKTSTMNYEIGRRLVDLEYISLVNLIGGKKIVPELIQQDVNRQCIINAIKEVRSNASNIKWEYDQLQKLLSVVEAPRDKVARVVVQTATK